MLKLHTNLKLLDHTEKISLSCVNVCYNISKLRSSHEPHIGMTNYSKLRKRKWYLVALYSHYFIIRLKIYAFWGSVDIFRFLQSQYSVWLLYNKTIRIKLNNKSVHYINHYIYFGPLDNYQTYMNKNNKFTTFMPTCVMEVSLPLMLWN
jgi:hypothetical protein